MKVLVTGGAGFIGSHLAVSLVSEGHDVRVFDDLSGVGARTRTLPPSVQCIQGSILDIDLLDRTIAGSDAVVHLAARVSVPESIDSPVHTHLVNVTGTLRVLEAARRHQVRSVVLASSAAVYGSRPSLVEDGQALPLSPYGASKLAAEAYAAAYAASYDIDVKVLRLFNVYGPGQDASHPYAPVVARFVDRAARSLPLQIHGDGQQVREFVHVFTVCDVIRRALSAQTRWPNPVNVTFGHPVTLLGLARALGEALEEECGRPLGGIEWLPPRPGDIVDSRGSGELLRQLMPDVEPVRLAQGLGSLVRGIR